MNPPAQQQVTAKSTKGEIFEAYQNIVKKLEEIEKSGETTLPKQDEEKARKTMVLQKTESYSVAGVLEEIEKFKKTFAEGNGSLQEKLFTSLKSLAEELRNELSKLAEVRTAIEIEQQKLENIYGIKSTAVSVQEFLQLKEEEKKKWQQEKEEMEKERRREDEEYQYSLKLKRKKEQDEYAEKQEKIRQLFEEEMDNRKREIEEKEKKLQEQLDELEQLRKLRDQVDSQKEKAVKESLEKQQKELQKDFEVRSAMENQRSSAEKSLLEQKLKAQADQLAHFESEIITLKKELRAATDKAQELALTIIQSQKKEVKVVNGGEKAGE